MTASLPLALAQLVIDVSGVPISQGSKSARVQGRRAVLYDDNAKHLHPWREKITAAAKARISLTGWVTLDGPITASVQFWMPRPPSEPKRPYPHVKPDLDKLVRAVLDSLTVAGVWTDDSRVVRLTAAEYYATETCGVRIVVGVMA